MFHRILTTLIALFLACIAGCQPLPVDDGPVPTPIVGSRFVGNAHALGGIRRAVLLPVECPSHVRQITEFLPHALTSQVRKAGCFELVDASDHVEYACPIDAVIDGSVSEKVLVDSYYYFNADAVMLVRVNEYRAYHPMAIGLTIHLVDTSEAISLFSVDEYWSMNDPATAKNYAAYVKTLVGDAVQQEALMNSPLNFANFVASRIFPGPVIEMNSSATQPNANPAFGFRGGIWPCRSWPGASALRRGLGNLKTRIQSFEY